MTIVIIAVLGRKRGVSARRPAAGKRASADPPYIAGFHCSSFNPSVAATAAPRTQRTIVTMANLEIADLGEMPRLPLNPAPTATSLALLFNPLPLCPAPLLPP